MKMASYKLVNCVKSQLLSASQIRAVFQFRKRNLSKFSRLARRLYVPQEDGVIPAKESVARLPNRLENENLVVKHKKTSADILKSTMGEIIMTKSKRTIAVEGWRQVDDAIAYGLHPKILFLSKDLKKLPKNVQKLVNAKQEKSVPGSTSTESILPEIHRISAESLREWSCLDTPQGIIGIFKKPTSPVSKVAIDRNIPLTVILDNVREPGNLGSILRTAAGVGCKLLLSEGCVDPWEAKCLRGGNGAQFMVPMRTNIDLKNLHQCVPLPGASIPATNEHITNSEERSGVAVFLADSGTDTNKFGVPISDYTLQKYSNYKEVVLILGGETTGLSETVMNAAADLKRYYPDEVKTVSRVQIPMNLPIDSLNVANVFGIIGYEILRQFTIYRESK